MPRAPRVLPLALALAFPAPALAQDVHDAETLPKGVGGLSLDPAYSYGTERFGPKWHVFTRESILADFNDLELTKVIAGDNAQAIETLVGGLGITSFTAAQNSFGMQVTLGYGITDRLSVALLVPFGVVNYTLETWLRPTTTPMQSRYGVRDPHAIQCPNGELKVDDPQDLFDKILEDRGDDYRFNVSDLRKALTSDCLGYKDPIDKVELDPTDGLFHGKGARSYGGIRDIILGAKYKFWHTEHLDLAGIFYTVFPTGHPDDPDDLFDPNFGDGQWDMAFLAGATVPLGDFRIGFSAGYEVQFADSLVRRLGTLTFPAEIEQQIASGAVSHRDYLDEHLDDGSLVPIVTAYEKAKVSRKLGDNVYVYSIFGYQILDWLGVAVTIDFLHHFRDEITDTGARVADGARFKTEQEIRDEVDRMITAGMIKPEDRAKEVALRLPESAERKAAGYAWHTVRDQIVGGIGITATSIPAFLKQEFPIPVIVTLSASRFLIGKNIDTTDSIHLALTVPFAFGEVKDPAEYGYDDEPGRGLPWP